MALQMSEEQFMHMMQAIAHARVEGSLADCKHTFDGKRDHQTVENFISNVTTYISSKHIQEANAIRDFGLLLKNEAQTWWNGVKSSVKKFSEVTEILRKVFQPPRPNWYLLNEIGQDRQAEKESTDIYVTRQMSRITRLINYPLTEEQQIDLFYGHLRLKIKKAVDRNSVTTIMALLEKARVTEHHEEESAALQRKLAHFVTIMVTWKLSAEKSKEL